ncbi:hypothetical protein CIT26_15075 [Mesorhizobium temperatum]|uniref:Transposase IS701-like DDE domain-containing protein n=1 Tax=Mesorhizobium temperatum TaxID=241416 RepID=A0A271LNJ2_9HYPH|nr:hypothetical protein CIT26_15075 [Mesorhizobium temperatum]
MTLPRFRSPTNFIFRTAGRRIRNNARRPRFRQRSRSRPSRRSRSQIRTAKAQGVAPGVVLADAGYGADGGFRAGLSELDLTYVVGVQPHTQRLAPRRGPAAAQVLGRKRPAAVSSLPNRQSQADLGQGPGRGVRRRDLAHDCLA